MRVLLSDCMDRAARDYTAHWAVSLMRDFEPWKSASGDRRNDFQAMWPVAGKDGATMDAEPRKGSVPEGWVR